MMSLTSRKAAKAEIFYEDSQTVAFPDNWGRDLQAVE